jgi:hypothetical protein
MVRPGRTLCLLIIAVVLGSAPRANAETPQDKQKPAVVRAPYNPRQRTLEVWGGIGHPFNYGSFKRFWMRGPAAGFALYLRATDEVKIGFGSEATLFSFREGNFAKYYPTVPAQVKDIAALNVFLALRRYFRPAMRWSPWIGGEVGFTRISGAEYKEIVNAVRVTYYEVPAAYRLTGTLTTGVDYFVSRRIAVQMEARLSYLHNDESLGLAIGVRGGVKFTL